MIRFPFSHKAQWLNICLRKSSEAYYVRLSVRAAVHLKTFTVPIIKKRALSCKLVVNAQHANLRSSVDLIKIIVPT